jgi:undecaprenyl-diphosphatase
MNIIQAVILGLVEGITEFLPISSTFHLIFTAKLLGLQQTDFVKSFEVIIQTGAILAAVAIYAREVWEDKSLAVKAMVAFIPTGVVGFLLHDIIKGVFFESELFMLVAFVVMGFVFLLVEYAIKRKSLKLQHTLQSFTIPQAALIGLVQAAAVLPGVSRAGAVIIAMMILGIKREEAARFSFLLAIPTIMAASVYDAYKMREVIMAQQENIMLIFVGFFVAMVTAYFVMRWFISFLKSNTLVPFAIYRFVLVIIILLVSL